MQNKTLVYKDYFFKTAGCYWSKGISFIKGLPIVELGIPYQQEEPVQLLEINLPEWGKDLGVNGYLLAPLWAMKDPTNLQWQEVDWINVANWMLICLAEQSHEKNFGPIHSYSYLLKGWDSRLWEYAWVNRIALFLRRWAAHLNQQEEEELFGPLPKPEIWLTHDLDAVKKTLPIRLKQTAFCFYNALYYLGKGNVNSFFSKFKQASHFFFSNCDYWRINQIVELEESIGVRGVFFVYGGWARYRSFKQWLIDPGYNVIDSKIADQLKELIVKGWQIGLHQSCQSWSDLQRMAREKNKVEEVMNISVTKCRQHWLKFSWKDTWETQEKTGLKIDMTLGFNDRYGFRNASALAINPYIMETGKKLDLTSIPMVLMDSHLYDYAQYSVVDRTNIIKKVIDEIYFVKGQASIIWHPHTISDDYGWLDGFVTLLQIIAEKENCYEPIS